jgi:glycerol uptake facilitator-like aquaporin
MQSTSAETAGPRPEVAFWLSVALPGLGQIYAGAPLRGLLLFLLASQGLTGVLMSEFFTRPERRYQGYGVLGALLLGASWYTAAWHARKFSEGRKKWPKLYTFFTRPEVRLCWGAARAELLMALLFLLFLLLCVLETSVPSWFPDPPRYWFLYEVLVALYLAVFHAILEARGKIEGFEEAQTTGFLVLTLLATGTVLWVTSVPVEVLLIAYLLALPPAGSRSNTGGARRPKLQVARVGLTFVAGFVAFFFGTMFILFLWDLGGRGSRIRLLLEDDSVVFTVIGVFYYLFRAGSEIMVHWPVPERPRQVRE